MLQSAGIFALLLLAASCGDSASGHPEGWLTTPPVPARMESLEASVARRIQARLDAVRDDPDSSEAWGELGMQYEVVVLRNQAIECYRQASLRNSTEARWWYRQGVCRGRMDEVRAAIADLDRSIELDPNYAPAQYRRGTLALEDGDLDLADQAFAEARRIDPTFMGGWVGRAHVLLLEDRPEEAVVLLEEQARRDPDDFEVLQLLNSAYRQSGMDRRVQTSEQEGEEGEGRFWDDPWQAELRRFRRASKSNRMARMIDDGKSDSVITQLEHRQEREPEETSFLPQLAEAYFDKGRAAEARATYRRMIEIEPRNIPARMALARLQVETGSPHLAISWLDKVIEINSGYGAAWALKGTILAAGTRYAESAPALERAIELDQRDPTLYLWLGKSEAALRDWESAEKHITLYFDRGGADPEALLVRARARAKLGKAEDAATDLRQAIAKGCGRPGQVQEVQRILDRLRRRESKRTGSSDPSGESGSSEEKNP